MKRSIYFLLFLSGTFLLIGVVQFAGLTLIFAGLLGMISTLKVTYARRLDDYD